MESLSNSNNVFIYNLKPYKNWFSTFLLILLLVIISFLIVLYSMLIYFEKLYFIIIPLLITIVLEIIIARQLIWIFKGITTIEINATEIIVMKNIATFNKYKSYYIEEINAISIESLFFMKALNKIPLFGKAYTGIIANFKRDSESIVITYRQKQIELLDSLTKDEAELILNKINYFLVKNK
jgi:hypothetical protein